MVILFPVVPVVFIVKSVPTSVALEKSKVSDCVVPEVMSYPFRLEPDTIPVLLLIKTLHRPPPVLTLFAHVASAPPALVSTCPAMPDVPFSMILPLVLMSPVTSRFWEKAPQPPMGEQKIRNKIIFFMIKKGFINSITQL